MQYTIDMSEMSSLLEMAQEEQDFSDSAIPFSEIQPRLESISGVSNIKVDEDKESYVFTISFDFRSISVLNKALSAMLNQGQGEQEYFRKEGKVLTRTHLLSDSFDTNELLDDEETASYAMNFLSSMSYKMKFQFKKPVQAVYSAADIAITGKKDKEVWIETDFKQLTENGEMLNTSIVLK